MYYIFWKDWIRHILKMQKYWYMYVNIYRTFWPWFATMIGTSNSKKSKIGGEGGVKMFACRFLIGCLSYCGIAETIDCLIGDQCHLN